jgi:peptide/nickel transport system substrate-binding protein
LEEEGSVKNSRVASGLALALATAAVLSACGSSSNNSSTAGTSSTSGSSGGGASATVVMGTAPDYLDPQLGYTTQSAEATYVTYTGLVTYAHANGAAALTVIPGLATAVPTVSADGKTYTATLRPGLKFSNGAAVKASDFTYSIERALKLNWGGDAFYTANIVGADAYQKGTSPTISGITADDATGKITIQLIAPYGAFDNVLAFPSSAIVPSGTAMKNLSNNPPPGVGPYEITNVVPNQSFAMKINQTYNAEAIPGIPPAHVAVNVKVEANNQTEAEDVLNGNADIFDPGDTLPPSLISQISASSHFTKEPIQQTFYFFLNTARPPFNNPLARQAVTMAIDESALSRLDSGNFSPGCYFLPPGIVGHPTAPCPYGDPSKGGDIAAAKALVAKAGLTGTPVDVYGETRSPRKEFVDYYASVLNQIGFKATEKILADATYFPTIGNLKLSPQTGFADWNQDFPNPIDFYLLLDSSSIQSINNQNFSQVKDAHIDSELKALGPVPASQLSTVAGRWQALDAYVAKQAYELVFGYQQWPKFASSRVDFAALDFIPLYGIDWSSIQLGQ